MRCSLHAEALAEYRQSTLYYAARGRRLGEAFATEVEALIAAIQTAPRARAANQRGVRHRLLKHFSHAIQYVIEKDAASGGEEIIVIYAIRHTRQDQEGWLHRLPPGAADV